MTEWLIAAMGATGLVLLTSNVPVARRDRIAARVEPYLRPAASGVHAASPVVRNRPRRARAGTRDMLPAFLDLVALSVTAGETLTAGIARAASHLGDRADLELDTMVREMRAGVPAPEALRSWAETSGDPAVRRFVEACVIALETGAPLAATLRAQAADLRSQRRRDLLESGGRREVLMLVPVVFLILPVVVIFVLYPGLVTLDLIAR